MKQLVLRCLLSAALVLGTRAWFAGARAWAAEPIPAWFPQAPPLPPPGGKVIRAATADELLAAAGGAAPGTTILVGDGHYRLPRVLVLAAQTNLTIRGASGEPAKATLAGQGWDGDAKGGDLIHIGHCDGIVIADLTFADSRSYGIK